VRRVASYVQSTQPVGVEVQMPAAEHAAEPVPVGHEFRPQFVAGEHTTSHLQELEQSMLWQAPAARQSTSHSALAPQSMSPQAFGAEHVTVQGTPEPQVMSPHESPVEQVMTHDCELELQTMSRHAFVPMHAIVHA
jgi:hypothetical protein